MKRRSTARPAARRDAGGRGLLAWDLGYIAVAVLLATATAWPVYETPRLLLVAVVAGAAGIGVAWASRRLRWGVLVTAAVALGAYLLLVVPLAVPAALDSPMRALRGVRDGLFGLVLGWKQLVTLSLPLGEYQAVLVPFFAVVLLGSLVAALLALRGGRWAPLAAAVVALMAAFGIAFGSSATSAPVSLLGVAVPAPRELALGATTLLATAGWLLGRAKLQRSQALALARSRAGTVRRRAGSRWPAARRYALAGGLVVVATALGLAAAPAAAGLVERSALRDEIEPTLIVRQQPSPLAGYRGWFAGDRFDAELFTVTGERGELDRLRLATLAAYDGEEFHVAANGADDGFRRLPRSAAGVAADVELSITVGDGYRGIWLPSPGGLLAAPDFTGARAEELADGFFVDADGATAVQLAGDDAVRGLRAGDGYRLLAEVPAAGAIADWEAGEAAVDAESHPALAEWVASQEVERSGAGLVELVDRLRARGYLSHSLAADEAAQGWMSELAQTADYRFRPSPAGHSTARIERLFAELVAQERQAGPGADPEFLVAAVGDDEQFATAAALLAGYLGFDARVVVGVRLAEAGAGSGGGAAASVCDTVCTGGDLAAWAEVRGPDGAWAPLDASPQSALRPIDIAEGEQLPENATVPDDVAAEPVEPMQVQSDDRPASAPRPPAESDEAEAFAPVLRAALLGTGAAASLALPLVVLFGGKRARRESRRRAADPELRVLGAWEEFADLSAEYGMPLDAAATRSAAAAASGRASAVHLAAVVDAAVFAEHPPGDDAAALAWRIVDEERAALRAAHPMGARLRAAGNLVAYRAALAPRRHRPMSTGKEPVT